MTNTTDVPDIWFKSQRVLRTIVQVGIPAFLSGALLLPQIIDALGLPVGSKLRVDFLLISAAVTAVAAGLTRVMAIPAVNSWLTIFGLGSVPRSSAAVGDHVASADPVATVPDSEIPDPQTTTTL